MIIRKVRCSLSKKTKSINFIIIPPLKGRFYCYLQHNSGIADGLDGLGAALQYFAENNLLLQYDKIHQVLGEGNFVLTVSEGKFGPGDHVAYYDLFRVENGKIVEHWDIIETIPAKADWKNTNGKF